MMARSAPTSTGDQQAGDQGEGSHQHTRSAEAFHCIYSDCNLLGRADKFVIGVGVCDLIGPGASGN